ncbi:MAG: 3-deoxy-D-manno-octulosonic acid transferase [Muribaculaceae bacterium]|nr:3-deoxy-D-manno-octulosonic acid transferase [Muribaculaceae bacterium]
MDPIYNFGILAYRAAVRLASLRKRKARLMLDGQRDTFERLRSQLNPNVRYIWVHASSLGEFEQGRPLIEKIKANDPDAHIVLSFFSPSGYEVRKNYDRVDAVCYLPFDLPNNVKRFLDIVRPSVAIFVKYEFWGNYLMELRRRQVPTYIISAIFRPSQSFFKPWGGMMRKILKCFTTLFVQNEESRALLHSIGINNVEVSGDTRFDRVSDVRSAAREFPMIARFVKDSPFTMVMGSSWPPDEEIVLPYFNSHPGMKLIIAPHEFDHERLRKLMSQVHRPVGLYSDTTLEQVSALDCLIIDSFGILSSLYRYGQMAYVGGGFGTGIHNINEAAVYGIPVVFGPRHEKFQEAGDLMACGGGFSIDSVEAFESVMDQLLGDSTRLRHCGEVAGQYIASHLGATQIVYDRIFGQRKVENQ